MSKIRIYFPPSRIADQLKVNDRAIIHKIKDVLRLKTTEPLSVFDGCGKEYSYQVAEVTKKAILLKEGKLLRKTQPPVKKITLAFPLEKEDRVDFILQKASELGVWEFTPFICQRSIQIQPSANKLERWQRIVVEASRQSQRLWMPQINPVLDFNDLGELGFDLKLVGKLAGKQLSKKFDKTIKNVLVAVGPVGDFTDDEYKKLDSNGFQPVKLSDNLLRTETAAVFAVGLVNNFLR